MLCGDFILTAPVSYTHLDVDKRQMLASAGGFVNEVEVQARQMVQSVQTLFNDTIIHGDTSKDSKAFDGLSKALTGTSTEYNACLLYTSRCV